MKKSTICRLWLILTSNVTEEGTEVEVMAATGDVVMITIEDAVGVKGSINQTTVVKITFLVSVADSTEAKLLAIERLVLPRTKPSKMTNND